MLPDQDPADIISLELVKEYIGLDDDLDAEQNKVLPVLIQAAIEQGEQITGIVWAEAQYKVDGLLSLWPGIGMRLPLSPVFSVESVSGCDASGNDVAIPDQAYEVIASAIEFGRPWAVIRMRAGWPMEAVTYSVTCTAGWNAGTLPEGLRGWALARIATAYDMRTSVAAGITAMPRHHARGLLDRWTVRGTPDG